MLKRLSAALMLSVLLPAVAAVAENIISFSNHGTVRWQCVEVVDGEDVPLTDHVVKEVALGCAASHQLLYPDRHFDAVSRERIHTTFTPEAAAAIFAYNTSPNDPDSECGAIRTTAYPDGNCPLDSPTTTNWTEFTRGSTTVDINEVSDTEVDVSVTGSGVYNVSGGYKTAADTGDIQILGQVPASFTGHVENYTSAILGIGENNSAGAFTALCWCPDTGSWRFSTGTSQAGLTTQVGPSGSCYGEKGALQYDQSATSLSCLRSADGGSTYTQVGNSVTQTLDCTGDSCVVQAGGISADANATTGMTWTNLDVGTSLTVSPEAEPDPEPNPENIIVNMDFSTGDFTQWPWPSDPNFVTFFQAKALYGRPIQYGSQICESGDIGSDPACHVGFGDLLALCTATGSGIYEQCPFGEPPGPSDYAARFEVANSANGSEPADCDGSVCTRRRTEITNQAAMVDVYDAFPHNGERWIWFSVYVPSNWSNSGSGFGPNIFSLKPRNESGSKGSHGITAINIENGNWRINHRWSPLERAPEVGEDPWQYGMFYAGGGSEAGGECYPRASGPAPLWADGVAHFPNEAASCAALQDLNKGGWTEFAVHIKVDHAGSDASGTGFLDWYMRKEGGSWVHVLDIDPGEVTRGGETFNHGIGFGDQTGGYGPKVGLYMDKDQVWNLSENRVLYWANMKFGDANASCSDGTTDGSDCTQ